MARAAASATRVGRDVCKWEKRWVIIIHKPPAFPRGDFCEHDLLEPAALFIDASRCTGFDFKISVFAKRGLRKKTHASSSTDAA